MSVDRKAIRKSLSTNFSPGPRHRVNRLLLRLRQAGNLPALLSGAELDRPIFIVGAPRSGTSMLFAILRVSGKLAHWPGEAHEVWEADHHPALRDWDSNVLSAADADIETVARIRRSFFLVTGRTRRLIDKTPRNALRIGFVDEIFPDARYIFLVREGRDNVNSLVNAWRTPRYRTYELPEPHAIVGADPRWWKFVLYPGWQEDTGGPLERVCACQWVASNEHALAGLERIDPERHLQVRYESLVADPVAELRNLLDWLGLPRDKSVEEKALEARTRPVNVVTPPEPGKWRRENPAEIEAILPLIAPTMERLGYPIDGD